MATSIEEKLGFTSGKEEIAASDDTYESPVTEFSATHDQVVALAQANMDFLAGMAMPTVAQYNFPERYQAIWMWLLSYLPQTRVFPKLALGLPRGFAKTTFIKLFILYVILFTDKKFIMVIAATAAKAEGIIADVIGMLEEVNIKRSFGDYSLGLTIDRQEHKEFGFRGRHIIIFGDGQNGKGIRGSNFHNNRPDLMIFEDIQTREDADSQVVSEGIERWMQGTAMKAKSPFGCMYIFVANMYPTKWSILRRLKDNPSWIKFIAGAILEDGTSFWEELHPIAQLLEEYESDYNSGHPEIFFSEVMNDENASANNAIDLSKIPAYAYDGSISAGSFIVIDPSNDKSNSDAVSIGNFDIYEGTPVLTELIEDRLSPGDTIRKALKMAMKRGASLIAVEANAYQYSLCYWFEVIMQEIGMTGIEVVPIYSGSLAKNTRILTMFKAYAKGELAVHPDTKAAVHSQIIAFNPLRRDNTDGVLDLLTYAPRVLTEFSHFITINSILGNEDFDTAKVWDVEDTCSF